jgi:hypothetical protein
MEADRAASGFAAATFPALATSITFGMAVFSITKSKLHHFPKHFKTCAGLATKVYVQTDFSPPATLSWDRAALTDIGGKT